MRLGRTQEEIDSTGGMDVSAGARRDVAVRSAAVRSAAMRSAALRPPTTFTSTLNPPPGEVVFVYRSANGVNPSFGELALMYSKPRAASIFAVTNGVLWGLDRRVFRKLLIRTNRPNLIRTLRRVEVLKVLSSNQVQRLCDMMAEVKFDTGDYIIKQHEMGDTFYIIMEGTAKVTQESVAGIEKVRSELPPPGQPNPPANPPTRHRHRVRCHRTGGWPCSSPSSPTAHHTLAALSLSQVLLNMKENDYFGERALLNNEPRWVQKTGSGGGGERSEPCPTREPPPPTRPPPNPPHPLTGPTPPARPLPNPPAP